MKFGRILCGVVFTAFMSCSFADDVFKIGGIFENTKSEGKDALVGEHSDPGEIVLRGCKTFTEDEVRRTAACYLPFRRIAYPETKVGDYLNQFADGVRAAYANCGFPKVKTKASFDSAASKFVVTVEEGPRYRCGKIVVHGLKEIPEKEFVEKLTTEQPPENAVLRKGVDENGKEIGRWYDEKGKEAELEEPLWISGKPSSFVFHATTIDSLNPPTHAFEAKIKNAFGAFGRFFPKYRFFYQLEEETGVANLVVEAETEGPISTIDSFTITGNEKNTDQAIGDFLALPQGTPITRDLCQDVQTKLTETGRFLQVIVKPMPPKTQEEAGGLGIDVKEFADAPLLSEKLDQGRELLLRAGCQLSNPLSWDGDLVLDGSISDKAKKNGHWEIHGVISSLRGCASRVAVKSDVGDVLWDDSIIADIEGVSLISNLSRSGRRRLSGEGGVVCQAEIVPNLADGEGAYKFLVGVGAHTKDKHRSRSAIETKIYVSPCIWTDLRSKTDCAIENDVATISRDAEETFRVDMKTGKFLEYKIIGNKANEKSEGMLRIRFIKDAYAKTEIAAKADCEESSDCEMLLFAIDEYFRAHDLLSEDARPENRARDEALLALRVLAQAEATRRIESQIAAALKKDEDTFDLPNNQEIGAWQCFQVNDRVFSRESWPWRIAELGVIAFADRQDFNQRRLQSVANTEGAGPLRCLVLAKAMGYVQPQAASAIAKQGLACLDVKLLRQDVQPLLDDRVIFGKTIRKFVEAFRDMTPVEIDKLRASLPEKYRSMLDACNHALRDDPRRSLDEAIPDLIDKLWDAGLKDILKGALEAA